MSDYLLQCAASNWLVSSVLAAFAWFAQSKLRRPVIAHLLWLLVLVKLVTPPLFSLAVLPAPTEPAVPVMTELAANYAAAAPAALASNPTAPATMDATTMLLGLWLLGSVIVLVCSAFRIVRFHRLLTLASRPAPQDLNKRAAQLAKTLGLKKTPSINITSARVTPMVWWVGGKVRIFIPEAMPAELGGNKMRWILAHELGHVRRRDHFVRWLEWLACVAFWWNPIAWLARRNLRANEEVCCDALVLRSLKGKPHSYANSLLAAVEFLASPGLRPPAMASEINSGGFLERRFRMIVSKTPIAKTPRWLQAVLVVCTVAVMPLGIAYAQNPDVGAVTKRLRKAVQAGELSPVEARKMLRTLEQSDEQDPRQSKSKRSQELEHYNRLVKSLEEGLREGVQSGAIDKKEALKLYEKEMAILKGSASKKAQRTRRAAQNKASTLQDLKRSLERAVKSGDITKKEAMARAAKWVEQQSAEGMELDVNSQRMRRVEHALRDEQRALLEAQKRAVELDRNMIRKQFEKTRRRLPADVALEETHAARAKVLHKLEQAQLLKEQRNARNEAKQLEAIETARRDLAHKTELIHKMQAELAKEQALLEAAVLDTRKAQDPRVDFSGNGKKRDRIKSEQSKAKAQAKALHRIQWNRAMDMTKAKADLSKAKKLHAVEFMKVQAERDQIDQLKLTEMRAQADAQRAIDFSRKQAATVKDLNRLRTVERELKLRDLELRAADRLRAIEMDRNKKPKNLELKTDLTNARLRLKAPANLVMESLRADQKLLAEQTAHANLRLKERAALLEREAAARLDTELQEQLNRKSVQLKRERKAGRESRKTSNLKTRAIELKREMELRRAIENEAKAAKARAKTKRRSGIR